MIDERLAPNFWLSELLHSDLAVRLGVPNDPTPEALANLRTLTGPGIQRVRNLLNCPVSINSGYRGAELNRRVGGSATSQHCEGWRWTSPRPALAPRWWWRASCVTTWMNCGLTN